MCGFVVYQWNVIEIHGTAKSAHVIETSWSNFFFVFAFKYVYLSVVYAFAISNQCLASNQFSIALILFD